MVSLAVVGVGSYLTAGMTVAAGYSTAAIALTQIAISAAATAAYAYVDQPYVIPALFGDDSPKDQNRVGNLQLPTTNPGEPRYKVYGREAYVPGHFLWVKNQKVLTTSSGGGSGKGATAKSSVSERFADIGFAACDGPITSITSVFSNRAVFYGERSSSSSVFSDTRVDMFPAVNSAYYGTAANDTSSPGGWNATAVAAWGNDPRANHMMVYINPSFGVTELMSDHFDSGDVVELFSVGEGDQAYETAPGGGGIRRGLYSVFFVGRDHDTTQDYMILRSLSGQSIWDIPGGVLRSSSEQEPVIIRRVDESICGYTCDFNNPIPIIDINTPTVRKFSRVMAGPGINLNTTLEDYQFNAEPSGTTHNGRPETLIRLEVWGTHGGWEETWVSGTPGANQWARPTGTKLSKDRLKKGNNYELQGFCDVNGAHTDISIDAVLQDIIEYPDAVGWYTPAIQHPISNNSYEAGNKYVLVFRCYTDDVQYVMDDLGTGGTLTGGGDTGLYPGNGQFNPFHKHASSSTPEVLGSVVDLSAPASPTTLKTTSGLWVKTGDSDARDRTGGASPSERGGLGDVGFCVLPPRAGKFSYRTTLTGDNIGPQGAEFNNGDDTQDPVTNADGIAYRGLAHVSFSNLNLYQFGNAIPQASFKVREAEHRSVGDIVARMIEEAAPVGSVSPGYSTSISAYGYSVAGGTPIKHAIQPLAVAFGFSMQERAGTMTMLQDSELPVINVPATKLNAHSYSGSDNLMSGLQITKLDPDDLPQRVIVKYRAIASGNEEARAAGIRSPGSENAGRKDTIEYDLRPLVMTDGFAKTRAQQLLNKSRTESTTSRTVLPPSRMDTLPGTVISTGSNNSTSASPDSTTTTSVGLTERKGEVIPGSVSIHLRLLKVTGSFGGGDYAEEILNTKLVDDGNGALIGEPDGITFTYTVDYTGSGEWLLATVTTSGVTIIDPDSAPIRYEYYKSLTFRATKATLSGYDFTVNTPLVTTSHDHVFPGHLSKITRELPPQTQGGAPGGVLYPIEDPSINGPWGEEPSIGLALRAPGSGGATIYESDDGVSDWTEIGSIFGSATMMTIDSVVDSNGTALASTPSWSAEDTIESRVDWGTIIILTGDEWPAELSGSKTIRQVVEGQHNFIINEEVVGAVTVSAAGGITILSGLVRALRGTRHSAGTHAAGDQVIYLTPGDGGGIGHLEPKAGYAGITSSRFLRAVVPGNTLALTDTQTVETRGIRGIPAAAIVDEFALTIDSDDISFTWNRPPTQPSPIFGVDPLPAGYPEMYEVYAFEPTDVDSSLTGVALDNDIIAVSKAVWYVGDQSMGSPEMIHREITYSGAEQIADGFIAGDKVAIQCYAVSPAGRGPRCYPDFEETSVTVTAVG